MCSLFHPAHRAPTRPESVDRPPLGVPDWLNPVMSWRSLVPALLLVSGLAVAPAPAGATSSPHHPAYGVTAAAPTGGALRAQLTFVKNYRHQWDSTISWRAERQWKDGSWHVVDQASWRAGSGFGGPGTEDSCHKGVGWLPNGRYSLRQYDDYHGNLIHGRAFRLNDKRCRNGTLREQLFIHTEASAGNGQCPDLPGDQVCRWEYPKINDYRSAGCIKLSPPDLLSLTRHYHRYFAPRVRYRMTRVSLVVR
jgi:hypothetical protein